MRRIRIVKKTKGYKVGDTVEVKPKEASRLIADGTAIVAKDINFNDTITK